MSEKYGKYGVKYYAVAVVKKSNQGLNLNSLKGRKSCHTAARRTAGWQVPIGYMLRKEIMPAVACGNDTNDFLSVAEFFKESCVPGKEQNKLSRKRLNLWTDQVTSTFNSIPPCSVVFQGQYYIYQLLIGERQIKRLFTRAAESDTKEPGTNQTGLPY